MPQDQPVPGPINGLHLPRRTWKALQQGHITILDRLKAVADRLENNGSKTARVIRAEPARMKFRDKPTGLSGPLGETLTLQR
jgi:hypothetical protein